MQKELKPQTRLQRIRSCACRYDLAEASFGSAFLKFLVSSIVKERWQAYWKLGSAQRSDHAWPLEHKPLGWITHTNYFSVLLCKLFIYPIFVLLCMGVLLVLYTSLTGKGANYCILPL